MVQIIMALAIVAALVYFVLFRNAPPDEAPPQPYVTEVEKAEQVEQTLQQTQQLQQRQIDEQAE